MNYPLGWPIVQGVPLVRERSLQRGRGSVTVAVGDIVNVDMVIAQSDTEVVYAGMRGRVTRLLPERGAIIEGYGSVISGLVGIGRTISGPVFFFPTHESSALVVVPSESIVVVAGTLTDEIVFAASAGHAAGIIAASAPTTVLDALLGQDCSAFIDGTLQMQDTPLSIILLHGFVNGPVPREVLSLLAEHNGSFILCSPTTDIHRNLRPEIVLSVQTQQSLNSGSNGDPLLLPQARVSIVNGNRVGQQGTVLRLLASKQVFPSGIRAKSARIRLDYGEEMTIALTNLQRIG